MSAPTTSRRPLELRVPLWERVAYRLSPPPVHLTLYLYFRWNLPLSCNEPGWRVAAWRYWLEDRLIPGVRGRAWRRAYLAGRP